VEKPVLNLPGTPLWLSSCKFFLLCRITGRQRWNSSFRSTLHNPQHVLRRLFPPPKTNWLQPPCSRGHTLTLPELQFHYLRKNCIHRLLYTDI